MLRGNRFDDLPETPVSGVSKIATEVTMLTSEPQPILSWAWLHGNQTHQTWQK